MSRDALSLDDYLSHITQACARIERYTGTMSEAAFLSPSSELVQDGVIRNLEVVGEAANNIAKHHPEFMAANPQLPLINAYDMRNRLSHGYFQINLRLVWATVKEHVPQLANEIRVAQLALDGRAHEKPLVAKRNLGDDFGL
ncbi:DUF86 domain-containing protein [Achromobacter sp. GG226]|uniref:HepT-like ribonuclease domain-containing protein n=1 Tax=Verticiella alkaliphila TaxID=2779529 RepID=UPI001C0D5492|nr:DUF86 domain-containing protein [Verticiella sp. GG226]MBU4610296.1 DUF86 domain-containing protein [Verticiella sp. GG226]